MGTIRGEGRSELERIDSSDDEALFRAPQLDFFFADNLRHDESPGPLRKRDYAADLEARRETNVDVRTDHDLFREAPHPAQRDRLF